MDSQASPKNKTQIYRYMKWPKTIKSQEDLFLFEQDVERSVDKLCKNWIDYFHAPEGADYNIFPSTCIKINIQERKKKFVCVNT